jgi:ATP-dependent Clp protease ATP-binding subunit ClpA
MYQLAISRELNEVFTEAEKISSSMKDKFITEEHLFLSLFKKADFKTIDILKTF